MRADGTELPTAVIAGLDPGDVSGLVSFSFGVWDRYSDFELVAQQDSAECDDSNNTISIRPELVCD